jgi:hypothetical protein
MDDLIGRVPGYMWRTEEKILDEIGADPLDLVAEIRRLENKVQLAYQMAGHFEGNSRGRGAVSEAWAAAGRMLRGALDRD